MSENICDISLAKPPYPSSSSQTVENINMAGAKISKVSSMFSSGFQERHDLEQYVWTANTVKRLMKALKFWPDCCCLATPSLAHGMYTIGRDEVLLDIDSRFDYLPKFINWDIRTPRPISFAEGGLFRIIVFDPPFFYIPMEKLYEAVMTVCSGDTSTKLMIGFLKREESMLLHTFKAFHLRKTSFRLEYATVKPNKWSNYALYSNVDLPGIRRQKGYV